MTEPVYRARPARGFAKLARVVMIVGFTVAGGTAAAFLLLVVMDVAAAELDPVTWGSGAPDAMFRQAIGAAGIAIGAALGVGAIAQSISRLLFARQLAHEVEGEPSVVAAWPDRRMLEVATPFIGVWIYGVYFLVLDAIAIIIFALVAAGRPGDAFAQNIVLVAVVLALLMAALMVLAGTVWRRSWDDATARVRAVWGRERPSVAGLESRDGGVGWSTSTLRRFARRIGVAAGVAGAIGAATFTIAFRARQPCRRCDQNFYDSAGESAIDTLMTIAIPFTAFALVVLVVVLIALWLASVAEWSAVGRLTRDGGDRPNRNALARLLSGWWPGSTAGVTLVAIGWGAAPVLTGADLAVPGILPDALVPTLLLVGLVGVVVVWWSVGAAARAHNRVREAWSLRDIVPPRTSRTRRRTR